MKLQSQCLQETGKQFGIVLHTKAISAGCGEIPLYVTESFTHALRPWAFLDMTWRSCMYVWTQMSISVEVDIKKTLPYQLPKRAFTTTALLMKVFWKLGKGELRQQLMSYAEELNVDLMHQGDQKVEQYTDANRVTYNNISLTLHPPF